MKTLIQTKVCSIIYGEHKGEPNQELFRCPRELDDVDLKNYINSNRCMLTFEPDYETEDLKAAENYLGYYRLYFRNGWYGRWIETDGKISRLDCKGVDEIIDWFQEKFPQGCNYDMKQFFSKFPKWRGKNRYLVKPVMSKHYKVMIDTTYGNDDYPVRIYVYQ